MAQVLNDERHFLSAGQIKTLYKRGKLLNFRNPAHQTLLSCPLKDLL